MRPRSSFAQRFGFAAWCAVWAAICAPLPGFAQPVPVAEDTTQPPAPPAKKPAKAPNQKGADEAAQDTAAPPAPESQEKTRTLPGTPVSVRADGLPAMATPTEAGEAQRLPFTVPMAAGLTATDMSPGMLGRLSGVDPGIDRAEKACLARVIADTSLLGCAGTACEDEDTYANLLSLTDLVPGTLLRPEQMRRAHARLMDVGYFRAVSLSCLPDARGYARIAIAVRGNQFVRYIEFRGNEKLWQDELRNKLLIRAGDVLNQDTPDGMAALERQRAAIEAVYVRNGFDGAKVQARAVEERPGQLRVILAIDEGRRKRVRRVLVRLLEMRDPTKAEEDSGLVCPRISESALLTASELSPDDPYTARAGGRARTKVRTHLRRLGFGSPRVEVVLDESAQTVTIEVRTGRCNVLRLFVRDETGARDKSGYAQTEDEELLAALPFAESGLFDFDEADRGRQDLLGVLENRGYLFADVQLDFRPVPKGLDGQAESAITYYVTTGYISQVRGIRFLPADGRHFGDAQLKGVMATKAYDFLDTGGYAQIDTLLVDLDQLRQFYRNAGFFEFRYGLGLPEGLTPTSASPRERRSTSAGTVFEYRYEGKGFRILRPHGENFIYIEIPLTEGRRTRLRKLGIEGAKQVSAREVRRLLKLEEGEVISYDLLVQALRAVQLRYRNNGFFRMELKALCASSAPDREEGPCTAEAMLARDVDLRLELTEGEQVDVGEVFVAGNFDTRAEVILRDMPKSGTRYSAEAIFEANRKLRNLGLFSQVTFEPIGDDESPPRKRIALVVQVVESASRSFEHSYGFQTVNANRADDRERVPGLVDLFEHLATGSDRLSTGYGQSVGLRLPNLLLVAEGAYVDRNFARAAKELRLPLKLGFTLDGTFLETERPEGLGRDTAFWERTLRVFSFLPAYTDTRLFGTNYGLRVVAPYFLHDFAIGSLDTDRAGMLFELSRRWGKLSASLGLDAGILRFREDSNKEVGPYNAQLQIEPRLSYDAVDSPINPTRGFAITASLPFLNGASPVHKGDDPATPNILEGKETFELARFLKYEVTAKVFKTFGQTVTLAGHMNVGGALPAEPGVRRKLPAYARYRLGGQHGLRGYADDGLRQYCRDGATRTGGLRDPCDPSSEQEQPQKTFADGDAVLNGAIEARFPLARAAGVWGAAFWDFGGVAETWTGRSEKQIAEEKANHPGVVSDPYHDAPDPGFHVNSLRHGVGLGLRWLLSGQVPVRVDYGFAIGQRCRDIPTGKTVEACVRDDFGQLHIGVLYSF